MAAVVSIHRVEKRDGPAIALEAAPFVADVGLERDWRSRPGRARQITLIEAEALEHVAHELGYTVPAGASRRQVVVRGVALNETVGKRLRIGPLLVQVEELCDPCPDMEAKIGPGAQRAMAHRGGVGGRVLESGVVRPGDAVVVWQDATIVMEPIGRVRTQRAEAEDDNWGSVESRIVLRDDLDPEALLGIEDFSHAEVIFYFDQVAAQKIVLGARHPRNNPDWPRVGIFAQRGKNRPNRIGSTIVRVLGREGRVLRVAELDAIDNTPVLDIKPVMQEFLPRSAVRQPEWSRELMRRYWATDESS